MKKPLRALFYGQTHEHAPGKLETLKKMRDEYEIVAEISSITEFAVGSIISSSGYYTTKDGKRHKTKPQYKFQSRGRRGEQKLKHIPAAHHVALAGFHAADAHILFLEQLPQNMPRQQRPGALQIAAQFLRAEV